MVLPSWAYNMIAPVSINDVINKLALLVERTPQHNESFDITGPEIMNYKELIQRTAVVLNKRLPIVDLPIIPIWVVDIGYNSFQKYLKKWSTHL